MKKPWLRYSRVSLFAGVATVLILSVLVGPGALLGRAAPAEVVSGYDLSWHSVGGGGRSTGGGYALSAGFGPAGKSLTGGSFTLSGGFWAGAGGESLSEGSMTATPTATGSTTATSTPTSTATGSTTASATAVATGSTTATATPTPTSGTVVTPMVTIYFQPDPATIDVGGVVTLEVWINAGTAQVAAVDAFFEYEPAGSVSSIAEIDI